MDIHKSNNLNIILYNIAINVMSVNALLEIGWLYMLLQLTITNGKVKIASIVFCIALY